MTTVGIAMCRDEEDVIEPVLRHMATQVDAIVIADNRSTDRTSQILERLSDEWAATFPFIVSYDDKVGYEQSKKMSAMAAVAHHLYDADWIVPFDADEIWYGPTPRIADYLRSLPPGDDIVEARLFDHVSTGLDISEETNPIERLQWRRNYPAPLPKVACRYREGLVIEMGNHGAHYRNTDGKTSAWKIAIRHFPYRSPEQVVRKVRNGAEAYAATDLPEHFGAHWRQWGRILDEHGEDAIHDLFHTWYHRDDPTRPLDIDGETQGPLLHDPAPIR